MEAKVNHTIVGAFVLVLGTALIAGVLWLSSGGAYRKAYDTYVAYMKESVSGLSLDAPVRYRGVEIGRVRKIDLATEDIEQVQLTMDIERGTPVRVDTIAVLRVQGLTGIAYVELSGGHRDSLPLAAMPGQPYPVIGTGPSLMVRLDATLTTLLRDLTRTSESLNAVMDEGNQRAFKRALADLAVLTHAVAARSGSIDTALANTARVTAEMPQLIERVQRSAEAFEKMSKEVAGAGTSATKTLEATRGDVRQFAAETLPEVRQLVSEVRELTNTLRQVANQVEQNPSVLLYGKPAGKRGPGE